MEKQLIISYEELSSMDELDALDRALMQRAIEATATSYSPYSHFSVGAAIRMADGSVVAGSNQENLAYPSGLCAERTAMFSASAQRPGMAMEALAIVARDQQGRLAEAAPCGACRQVMAEYERRQGSKMRIIVYLDGGKIRCFDGVESLLPFLFSAELQ